MKTRRPFSRREEAAGHIKASDLGSVPRLEPMNGRVIDVVGQRNLTQRTRQIPVKTPGKTTPG